jgi:hypothetical protein
MNGRGHLRTVAEERKPKPLDDLRCPTCQRLMARARMVPGCVVELYCKHCRRHIIKECA